MAVYLKLPQVEVLNEKNHQVIAKVISNAQHDLSHPIRRLFRRVVWFQTPKKLDNLIAT